MREPDQFDAFYKDARERLLLQTFCLTGDLAASRRAVRDAFIVCWQRWRKVSLLDVPESSVRPHAWRLAQRRHTARVWARQRDLDPEVKQVLDALGKLTIAQRRALLLTQLAAVSMPDMAREVGLPLDQAERELQVGATQLALHCDVPSPAIPTLLDQVASWLAGRVRWPRAPIIRRAGGARRRTHTTLGVLGSVAAVAVTGVLVTDAGGVRPTLAREGTGASAPRDQALENEVRVPLPETSLVSAEQVDDALGGPTWRLTDTRSLTDSDVPTLPCQARTFALRSSDAAYRRVLKAPAGGKTASRKLTQVTEAAPSPAAAERAFRTSATWYAGCGQAEVQLLATRTPVDVGDEAVQLVLRSSADPTRTYVVGLARTGLFTTTTFLQIDDAAAPDRAGAAGVLGAAVAGLCSLEGAGACSPAEPRLVDRDPMPVGDSPALLSALDLPPVAKADGPWAGTPVERPTAPVSVSTCASSDFTGSVGGAPFTRGRSRIFVVVGSQLPKEFAISETAAALPARAAERFIGQVRTRIEKCPDRNLGTEVTQVLRRDRDDTSLTVWRLEVKITRKRTLTYYLASMRDGTAVGEVGFLAAGADLPRGGFVDVAERALARLSELPGPRS